MVSVGWETGRARPAFGGYSASNHSSSLSVKTTKRQSWCGLGLGMTGYRCTEASPLLCKLPPLLEEIASAVGRFDLATDYMGKGHFGNLRRKFCLFGAPIPKC